MTTNNDIPEKSREITRFSGTGFENTNRQFLVQDVFNDLRNTGHKAALVLAAKPSPCGGTELYLRVAPGLRDSDVAAYLSTLMEFVRAEMAAIDDVEGRSGK